MCVEFFFIVGDMFRLHVCNLSGWLYCVISRCLAALSEASKVSFLGMYVVEEVVTPLTPGDLEEPLLLLPPLRLELPSLLRVPAKTNHMVQSWVRGIQSG